MTGPAQSASCSARSRTSAGGSSGTASNVSGRLIQDQRSCGQIKVNTLPTTSRVSTHGLWVQGSSSGLHKCARESAEWPDRWDLFEEAQRRFPREIIRRVSFIRVAQQVASENTDIERLFWVYGFTRRPARAVRAGVGIPLIKTANRRSV